MSNIKKAYKFGIEIECIIPRDRYIELADFTKSIGYNLENDGTIRTNGDGRSVEIKTTPSGFNNISRNITKLSNFLADKEARVNKSCGLHLHISNKRFFKRKYLKRIIHTWLAIEDVFFSTQPESRLNNDYCYRFLGAYIKDTRGKFKNMPAKKKIILDKLSGTDRYTALNLYALAQHGTIEMRLHSGTIDKKKIINWVKLCRAFFDYCLMNYNAEEVGKLFEEPISDKKVQKVWKMLQLDTAIKVHFDSRVRKFLYKNLKLQQKHANEALKLQPLIEKARKRYTSAEADLAHHQGNMQNHTQVFYTR